MTSLMSIQPADVAGLGAERTKAGRGAIRPLLVLLTKEYVMIKCNCGAYYTPHKPDCTWLAERDRRDARYNKLCSGEPVSSFDDVDIIFRKRAVIWPPTDPPNEFPDRIKT